MPFGIEKLEWLGYQMVKNFEDMFIRFDRMHECDTHTSHDGVGRASLASRDKNHAPELYPEVCC